MSLLDWRAAAAGPGPWADKRAAAFTNSQAPSRPRVAVACAFAKAENDTSVLAVTVKLEKEGTLAIAL